MKVKEAEVLKTKIGKEFTMTCLMSKNTYRVDGVLKSIDLTPDPRLYFKVTEYKNYKYPKDTMFTIGKEYPIFLRKIVGIEEIE